MHGLMDLAQGDSTPEWGGGLLNLVPFSDTAGLTDPHERIHGRELLDQAAHTMGTRLPKNKPGMFNDLTDFGWDAAGFATEVLTDPLLYMTGPLGSLTKAGKAGKAAARGAKRFEKSSELLPAADKFKATVGKAGKGKSTTDFTRVENPASLIDQLGNERSMLGFKLPGQADAAFTLGDLPGGKKLDEWAAAALEKMHYGDGTVSSLLSAPMRGARSLWDISAQGKFAAKAQRMADQRWSEMRRLMGALDDFAPAAAAREHEVQTLFGEVAKHLKAAGDDDAYRYFERYAAEMPRFNNIDELRGEMGSILGKAIPDAPPIPTAQQVFANNADALNQFPKGFGWKLHITPTDVGAVESVVKTLGVPYKIGRAGGQTGKGMTLYVGSKDAADITAGQLDMLAGKYLANPVGDVLVDDAKFAGNVMGRFDAVGDAAFHQYGTQGTPYLSHHMDPFNRVPDDVARKAAHDALTTKYGDFYGGAIGKAKAVENVNAKTKELADKMHEYVALAERSKNIMYKEVERLGGTAPNLNVREWIAEHVHRRAKKSQSDIAMARKEMIVNIPGGTAVLNWMARNDGITAPQWLDADHALAKEFLEAAKDAAKVDPKVIQGGIVVRANDRGNIGRVVSVNKDKNTAIVDFYNKKTGASATKTLDRNILEPLQGHADELSPMVMVGTDNVAARLRQQLLDPHDVTSLQEFKAIHPNIADDALPFLPSDSPKELAHRLVRNKFDDEIEKAYEFDLAALPEDGLAKATKELNEKYANLNKELDTSYATDTGKGIVQSDYGKIDDLLDYFEKASPDIRKGGIFPRLMLDDEISYVKTAVGSLATMRETHNFLKVAGVLTADKGAVRLDDAWKQAGFDEKGLKAFAGDNAKFLKGMGKDGKPARLEDLMMSERAANALKPFKKLQTGEAQHDLVKVMDQVTSWYKWGLTGPFPSFHVRNRLSGVWQAWSEGNASLPEIAKGGQAIKQYISGQKTLDREFLDFLRTSDLLGNNQGLEFGLKRVDGLEDVKPLMEGLLDPLKSSFKGGVKDRLNAAPSHAFNYVETLNRAGYAKALWDKGYRPSEITNMVRRTQFDYSELTGAEKMIMKRLIPFFTFTKKNVPYQIKKLAEQPGGRTAQTFRSLSQYDPEEEYTPGFIKEKLAIRSPLKGHEDPGEQTFVTQTGLPIEDYNKVVMGPGGGRRSAQKLASNLHPLLGAGIRQFTGEDPYTGRELKHLKSQTESVGIPMPEWLRPYVDRTIQASPASRALSETAGIAKVVEDLQAPGEAGWDLVKGAADLLTGANFGTYDVDQAKARDLASAQRKLAETYPQVLTSEQYFVPKDRTGPQAEEARQAVGLLRQLDKASRELRIKREREKLMAK